MKPEKIKEIRNKLQMSQEQFARKVGVSLQSVYRWESGRAKPIQAFIDTMETLDNSFLS